MKNKVIEAFEAGDTTFKYFTPATRYIVENGVKIPLISYLITLINEEGNPKIIACQKSIISSLINLRDKSKPSHFKININLHAQDRLGLNNFKAIDTALMYGQESIAIEMLKRDDISLIKPVVQILGHGESYKTPFAIAVDYCPNIAKYIIDNKLIDTTKPVYSTQFESLNAREYVCKYSKPEQIDDILDNDPQF